MDATCRATEGGAATQFEGALITEQGVTFGIVVVQRHVLSSPAEKVQMDQFGRQVFGNVPVILMAQDVRCVPTYFGRPDIVKFLANVDPSRIPWQRYTT